MENNKLITNIINIVLVMVIIACSFFAGTVFERENGAGRFSQFNRDIQKIDKLIDENFYFKDNINQERAFKNSIFGYVASLGDQFSYYLDESDNIEFSENINGDYVGIGVEISIDNNNFITVTRTFAGSAAEKAGINIGDRIIGVEGDPVTGDMLDETVARIRGKIGEDVAIQILTSNGSEKNVVVTRATVTKETISIKTLNNNIGYVKIAGFDAHTTEEFKTKFAQINVADLKGLIVDLRSNSGGLLSSVVDISDIFMPEGEVVKVKYTSGEEKSYKSDEKNKVTLPIVVLVNQWTASAAELLAGGLKDNNKAILIGQKTFGKGVVNQDFGLTSKTALVLTVGEYFLPSGKNIHKVGIEPDFYVELSDVDVSLSLLPEEKDSQLQKAIEVLSE